MAERARNRLEMQKVAEAAARTVAARELTRGLVKVDDRRELGIDRFAVEPAVVHVDDGLLGVLLVPEFDVRVAAQMLAHVLADVELLDLAILVLHLDEELLVRVVEVALQLLVRVVEALARVLQRVERTKVEIAHNDRLAVGGHVMQLGALETVSTRADLEIERAVDFVLFGAENRGQEVGHL